MTAEFAPKDADTLKSEITTDLGIEYEGNEEMVDKLVARGLKDEDFKASVHKDKMTAREKLKETRKLAGLDPETGEKLSPKGGEGEDKTSKNDTQGSMSLQDIRALQDVHDEDVEDVVEWAKFKRIAIADAKKTPHIQSLLKTKTEERASALAANTAPAKRGTNRASDEQILNDFNSGKISNKDEDIQKLAEVQMARKKAGLKRN